MSSFALITEGDTDQVVIGEIIQTFYIDQIGDEVEVREVQPLYDETRMARSKKFGGWEMMLDFCSDNERMLQAFSVNEYMIIQIDTDICEHEHINISKTTKDGHKSTVKLIEEMIDFIIQKIPTTVYESYKDKIFFAIAVHSLECWLLPLHCKLDREKKQTISCEDKLYIALAKKKIKYVKDKQNYSDLCKDFRKIKFVTEARLKNESLDIFLQSLPDLR